MASQAAAGQVQRGEVKAEVSAAQLSAGLPAEGSTGGLAAHVVTAVEARPVHPLTIAIQALLADAASRSEMERPGSAGSSRRSSSPSPTKQTAQGSSAAAGRQGQRPESPLRPSAQEATQGQHSPSSVQGFTGGKGQGTFDGKAQSGGGREASRAAQAAAGEAPGSMQVQAGTARSDEGRPASPRGAGAEVGLGSVEGRERGSPRSPHSNLTAERLRCHLSGGSSQTTGGAAREAVEALQPASRTVGFAAPAGALDLHQLGAADAVQQAQVGLGQLLHGDKSNQVVSPSTPTLLFSPGSTSNCLTEARR